MPPTRRGSTPSGCGSRMAQTPRRSPSGSSGRSAAKSARTPAVTEAGGVACEQAAQRGPHLARRRLRRVRGAAGHLRRRRHARAVGAAARPGAGVASRGRRRSPARSGGCCLEAAVVALAAGLVGLVTGALLGWFLFHQLQRRGHRRRHGRPGDRAAAGRDRVGVGLVTACLAALDRRAAGGGSVRPPRSPRPPSSPGASDRCACCSVSAFWRAACSSARRPTPCKGRRRPRRRSWWCSC